MTDMLPPRARLAGLVALGMPADASESDLYAAWTLAVLTVEVAGAVDALAADHAEALVALIDLRLHDPEAWPLVQIIDAAAGELTRADDSEQAEQLTALVAALGAECDRRQRLVDLDHAQLIDELLAAENAIATVDGLRQLLHYQAARRLLHAFGDHAELVDQLLTEGLTPELRRELRDEQARLRRNQQIMGDVHADAAESVDPQLLAAAPPWPSVASVPQDETTE